MTEPLDPTRRTKTMATRTARKSAPTAEAPPLEFLDVDPATLIVGANVRLDPRLDAAFIASIGERGVIEPITAYHDGDDQLVVEHGQRRTLAAVQVGRPAVPVRVVPPPADMDRLVDQLNTDHRAPLTIAERAAGYEQLAAFGLTADQIAKHTATARPIVEAGLLVAKAPAAAAAADQHQLTIEQAAVVAEFADDEQAVDELVEAAEDGGFDHAAQRLRDERERATARSAAEEELRETGVTVIPRPTYEDKKIAALTDLLNGKQGMRAKGHAKCPGHVAWMQYNGGVNRSASYEPVYGCADYRQHGHTHRWRDHSTAAATKTEQEKTAAAAERRDVITSNKAWASALKVRQAWLREFLQRRTAPKDAGAFIAASLARPAQFMVDTAGNRLAHELLAASGDLPAWGASAGVQQLVDNATGSRADLLALGLLLCAHEAWTNNMHWRSVRDETARYLKYLQQQGYELSVVELRACGEEYS